jgi:CubicO group peptidase (beta-lactamase class C family)
MEPARPGQDDRQLDEVAEQARRRHGVPGLAVGLVHPGGEQVAGYAVTNVEHPLPVDGETLFHAASITKTLTATAVLRLVERGALALDAPVRTYLPDLRLADEDVAARVTLAHLLTHTAGWPEPRNAGPWPHTGPGDDALARFVATLADLPQERPLGTHWAYSNHSHALLGRVIEVATRQTYEAALSDLVLAPLGMTRSCFFLAEAITHRVAASHLTRPAGPAVARPWWGTRAANPAGGLLSTARDLLRFACFHLGDGTAPTARAC